MEDITKEKTNKPIVVATETDVSNMNNSLSEFSKAVGQRVTELKELSHTEVCLMRDERNGVWIELHSGKLPTDKLLNLCERGFKFIKSQRKGKQTAPLGIG